MKKIILIMLTVFLNMVSFSCTPQGLTGDSSEPQACCDEDGPILPPPPPPPPNGG